MGGEGGSHNMGGYKLLGLFLFLFCCCLPLHCPLQMPTCVIVFFTLPSAIQKGSSCRPSTHPTCSLSFNMVWAARRPGPARGKPTSWPGPWCSSMSRYRSRRHVFTSGVGAAVCRRSFNLKNPAVQFITYAGWRTDLRATFSADNSVGQALVCFSVVWVSCLEMKVGLAPYFVLELINVTHVAWLIVWHFQ